MIPFRFANEEGNLPNNLLGHVVRELGFYPSKLLISQLCSQADPERIGVVKRKDFMEIMRKMVTIKKPTEEEIKNAFAIFDREKNGFIPTARMRFQLLILLFLVNICSLARAIICFVNFLSLKCYTHLF